MSKPPKIKDVLLRINDTQWPTILERPIWDALKEIYDAGRDQERLAEFALEIHGGEAILLNEEKRNILYRKLHPDEIEDLCQRMGIGKTNNPLAALIKTKIRLNSRLEGILLQFFEVDKQIVPDTEKNPDCVHLNVERPLHNYQKNVLLKSLECVKNRDPLLIHMPTGSGKTRVAMNLLSRLLMEKENGIILWLAYSEELCEQATEEFITAWKVIGDRNVDVLRFFGDHAYSEIDDGIIIASLKKLGESAKRNPPILSKISKKAVALVFDEAHQSIAPTYVELIETLLLFNSKISLIGLSATPGRTDPIESSKLAKLFGKNKVQLEIEGYSSPINYLYEKGYLSKPTYYPLEYSGSIGEKDRAIIAEELDISRDILTRIGEDGRRNLLIVGKAVEAIRRGHTRIILFAPSVYSAKFISLVLRYKGYDSRVVTSNTPKDQRKQTLSDFKSSSEVPMILCNFDVLTTGFDAPKITAVIIGRPTKSLVLYSQMVGRGTRGPEMGGTEEVDIITVADLDIQGFWSVVKSFEKWNSEWNDV